MIDRGAGSAWRVERPSPRAGRPWREGGASKAALAAAERDGFDGVAAKAAAPQLLLLGDSARLAGNPPRAAQAYTALRQRFAGSEAAATAAFHLGRLASGGSPAQAERWFAIYLQERPRWCPRSGSP